MKERKGATGGFIIKEGEPIYGTIIHHRSEVAWPHVMLAISVLILAVSLVLLGFALRGCM